MSALFGSKPVVPNLPRVSLAGEQAASIAANQAALPASEALASSTNAFNQQQLTQMLNTMIPGFSSQSAQMSKNTSALLSGEIPADVSEAISQSGSARALGGGYAGSGSGRNLVARDLGLTSLNLMNEGQKSLESWTGEMSRIAEPGQYNVEKAFVNPEQMYQSTNEQNIQQFQRNMTQNQIDAAPDPVAAGVLNTTMSLLQSVRGGSSSGPTINTNPWGGMGGGVSDMGGGMGGGMGDGGFGAGAGIGEGMGMAGMDSGIAGMM